jgi:manganese/zinc/iron transport system ATP- binding protein
MIQPIFPLSVVDLEVSYGGNKVLEELSFSLPSGVLAAIIGPNGAGKSSLLKASLGLIPSKGKISFWGDNFSAHRKKIVYLPQRENVDWDFPITVQEVVLMGRYPFLGLFSRPSKEDKKLAQMALEKVGIADLAERRISDLSGGQQRRTFMARALAQNADFYLLDEPFAGVDVATEKTMMAILKTMRDEGKTILLVHHDLQTVPQYFDYLILLNKKIIKEGKTEDVFKQDLIQETYGMKWVFH